MRELRFVIPDSEYNFSIDEDSFCSSEEFDKFTNWAVDMIRYIHENSLAITQLEVIDPQKEIYQV